MLHLALLVNAYCVLALAGFKFCGSDGVGMREPEKAPFCVSCYYTEYVLDAMERLEAK